MKKKRKRLKQAIKFLKWTRKYSGWWQLICEPNNEHMNQSMMRMLIEKLEKESFYEIIFVLLSVHKNEPFVNCLNESLFNDLLINEFKKGNSSKDFIIKSIIEYLE